MNLQDYKNAETLVKSVLRDIPDTRGDDTELIMATWEKQGLKLTPEQKSMIRKCHSPETITRARRKIQEMGIYLPSRIVIQQRTLLEKTFRNHFGDNE